MAALSQQSWCKETKEATSVRPQWQSHWNMEAFCNKVGLICKADWPALPMWPYHVPVCDGRSLLRTGKLCSASPTGGRWYRRCPSLVSELEPSTAPMTTGDMLLLHRKRHYGSWTTVTQSDSHTRKEHGGRLHRDPVQWSCSLWSGCFEDGDQV